LWVERIHLNENKNNPKIYYQAHLWKTIVLSKMNLGGLMYLFEHFRLFLIVKQPATRYLSKSKTLKEINYG
jgi:hypothetical protein